ncbi:Trigger factor [Bienertia sinuspersici]
MENDCLDRIVHKLEHLNNGCKRILIMLGDKDVDEVKPHVDVVSNMGCCWQFFDDVKSSSYPILDESLKQDFGSPIFDDDSMFDFDSMLCNKELPPMIFGMEPMTKYDDLSCEDYNSTPHFTPFYDEILESHLKNIFVEHSLECGLEEELKLNGVCGFDLIDDNHSVGNEAKWVDSIMLEIENREEVWEALNEKLTRCQGPLIILGDFNQVEVADQKSGGFDYLPGAKKFTEWRIGNGLTELPSHGPSFTWCNNRRGGELIYEQLDRAYCNKDWRSLFPDAVVINDEILVSNHGAILLESSPNRTKWKRPYKIEA